MRYQFTIEDEKTVTNDTVKVMVQVTGPVENDSRDQLEKRARSALKQYLPEADWVFGGFQFSQSAGYPLFVVPASCRIKANLNDDLINRANRFECEEGVRLQVTNLDQSIPMHLIRNAEKDLRFNLLEMVENELADLRISMDNDNLQITSFEFTKLVTSRGSKGSLLVGNAYSLDDSSDASSADAPIGYAEKIQGSASVVISDESEATYRLVRDDY